MGNSSSESKEKSSSTKGGKEISKLMKERLSNDAARKKAHRQVIKSMIETMHGVLQHKEEYPLLSTAMEIQDLCKRTTRGSNKITSTPGETEGGQDTKGSHQLEHGHHASTPNEKEGPPATAMAEKTANDEEKQTKDPSTKPSKEQEELKEPISTNVKHSGKQLPASPTDDSAIEIWLDFDYDEWMKHKQKYDSQLRDEVAKLYDVDPKEISFGNYRRGSTKIAIFFHNVWRWYKNKLDQLDDQKVADNFYHTLRAQDQVEVLRDNAWYMATVVEVQDKAGFAKYFKVRFNPKDNDDGDDPFIWNTEWFYTDSEDGRLRYEGKKYVAFRNEQGEDVEDIWQQPELADVVINNKEHTEINDHIFVKFDKSDKYSWSRCKVYDRDETDPNQVTIKVKNLQNGKTKKIKLWHPLNGGETDLISLSDRRPPKEGR